MAGEGCRREVRTLGESDLIITEEVERGEEFEVDVETDLGDYGQHAVVVRSELLGPGQGEEEETSPLYFNVGQSGMMKGWQVTIVTTITTHPCVCRSHTGHSMQSVSSVPPQGTRSSGYLSPPSQPRDRSSD